MSADDILLLRMCGLMCLAGMVLWFIGHRIGDGLTRYEFENRNPGGVVEFDTYGRMKAHNAKRFVANKVSGLGKILTVLFGCFLVLIYMGTK